ncbi:hypothetical protein SAMN04487970_10074 [Paenibacillus tianmuensis]|uniref:Uncharacterized protein n=1 Tax=Paenibacillus tianmuensis TaxID=624147 RepID=A0A1G4QGG0_9BACL|nr:hypothetical protein [Paenibacillus tianmuensis]SCW43545.1 hypothetical protein SAMN04487970_10074 [Paenibacillus tianmuensis]
MFKSNKWLLVLSVILFIGLLGLSVYYESIVYLHAASALPIAIVVFLPDLGRHQYIRSKPKAGVRFVKQTIGGDPVLTIAFKPGFIRWDQNRKLYFHLNSMGNSESSGAPEAKAAGGSGSTEAALAVLPFDLSLHPRKQGWIGIDLPQLAERTRSLSYTTDEVSRLLIRMADLEEAAMKVMVTPGAVTANKGKQLQA